MIESVTGSSSDAAKYGDEDATFQACGGEAGVANLVDSFYDIMSSNPAYRQIYDWHPDDALARDKLARFLCGWMGGPKRYHKKYGAISIPRVHSHLQIKTPERDMWLHCMREALERQPYPAGLRDYLLLQLGVPAEHVRRTCEERA